MNKFLLLLKINLKSILDPSRILSNQYNKSKKRQIPTLLMMFLLVVSLFVLACSYIFMFAMELNKVNMIELILPIGLIMTSCIILFTTIYQTQSYLFNIKDMDFLLSIPVSRYSVMLSKITTLYIESLLFSLFIFIPLGGVYIYYTELNYIFIFMMFIEWLFVPAIPLIISVIIGYIIGFISNKFRNKSIISIILSLLFFVAVMYGSFNMPNILNKFINKIQAVNGDMFMYVYYPSKTFTKALVNNDILALFQFIIISVIPYILFTYIMSMNYFKILSKFSESSAKSNYELKSLRKSNQIMALYKKEIKRYFSSTIYVLNTCIGMLMLLGMSVILLFSNQDSLAKLIEMPEIVNMMPMFTIAAMCLMISMTSTTCSSISTEGNNLWILKSMPVNINSIFISKIMVNLTIILPILYLSIILFSMKIQYTALQLIIAIVVPTILACLVSTFGLIVNLKLPKLDASDVAIVKQSASSLISMMGGMLVIMGICALYMIKLKEFVSFEFYSIIVGLGLFLALITCIIIINTKGKEYFTKL